MLQGWRGGQSDNITNLTLLRNSVFNKTKKNNSLKVKEKKCYKLLKQVENMKPSSRSIQGVMELHAARPTEVPHENVEPAPPIDAHSHHLERPSLTCRVREQQPDADTDTAAALASSQKLM